MAKVRLIAITKPVVKEIPNTEGLVVYCARASNPTNQTNFITGHKLLSFLEREGHWSPLEMGHAVIEIETTRDISRQILRHRSFAFQEFSQRYSPNLGFTTRECRTQDTKNRQSSHECTDFRNYIFSGVQWVVSTLSGGLYYTLLKLGVAKEQARAILPEGMTKTRLYMTGSLRSWIHYTDLRMGNGTQKEHAEIASLCREELKKELPTIF